jgi:hypothetical protein
MMSKYDDMKKLSVFEQRYCIKCKYKKEANNKIFCTYPMECPEISKAKNEKPERCEENGKT